MFIAKYNSPWNARWVTNPTDLNGRGDHGAYAIAVDSSGNSYVTGWFQGTANLWSRSESDRIPAGASDIFVVKCARVTGPPLGPREPGGHK